MLTSALTYKNNMHKTTATCAWIRTMALNCTNRHSILHCHPLTTHTEIHFHLNVFDKAEKIDCINSQLFSTQLFNTLWLSLGWNGKYSKALVHIKIQELSQGKTLVWLLLSRKLNGLIFSRCTISPLQRINDKLWLCQIQIWIEN